MGICEFSLIHIFVYMSLDFVELVENVAQRKPLYLHILYSVQLSQLVNLGTIFFSNAHAKFCTWSAKLDASTSCVTFFLAATSNSVRLWKCNNTFIGQKYWIYWISTKFHTCQIGFWWNFVSDADITFEQFWST